MNTAMAVYCLALFLVFDFVWSSFTQGQEQARSARIYNPVYDHGFAANFDGYDVWGEARYRLITDSLGFKDASTREVPLNVGGAPHPADRRFLHGRNRSALREHLRRPARARRCEAV